MNRKLIVLMTICLGIVFIYGLGVVTWNYFGDLSLNDQIIGTKKFKVGIVSEEGAAESTIAGLKDGLSELGYEENNKVLYYQINLDSNSNIKESLKKLSGYGVSVIYTISAPLTSEVRDYFNEKMPISL